MSDQQTVHVIDDDDALRDSVRLFLVNEGLSARTYGTANEFLAELDTLQSGCVVTDVRMPGMSGMELLAQIAAKGLLCRSSSSPATPTSRSRSGR